MRTLRYISQTSGYTLIINKLSIAFIKMVSKWSGVQFFFFFFPSSLGRHLSYNCVASGHDVIDGLCHRLYFKLPLFGTPQTGATTSITPTHVVTPFTCNDVFLLVTEGATRHARYTTTIQRPPLARNTHAVLLP